MIRRYAKSYFDFFPTFIWLIFMVLPFFILSSELSAETFKRQLIGVSLFTFALALGDWMGHRYQDQRTSIEIREPSQVYILLIILSVGMASIHLYLMPQIPLLQYLFNSNIHQDYFIQIREQSGKLLHIPTPIKYLFQYVINFVAPLSFAWLLRKKKYFWSLVFAVFILFYARSSMARVPMVIFLLFCLIFTFKYFLKPSHIKAIFTFTAIPALAFLIFSADFLISNELSIFNFKYPYTEKIEIRQNAAAHKTHFSISDHYRMLATDNKPVKVRITENQKFVNFLVQRLFLVPSDVASRWYQYYPDISASYLGFNGLTPWTRNAPGFEHPAHAVGLWAYYNRFPEAFLDTLHAYGSADSDLWSRFGYLGLFLFVFLYVGFRILISRTALNSFLGKDIYVITLILVGLTLPNGSVFAILVPHGVAALVLLQIFLYVSLPLLQSRSSVK